ncbi:hypothetical protein P175DRAFT_0508133 [Aspergillus ochraceoroseus IBT 24754]|uniref:Uncharacterized protein n=3 Tax=Aspergillus subgen. Nidulantes TaxID=2720870 RepID=A0A0F8V736_9EURO|nr:uncharacterized protein P175DRAFT_0508133 [Aspergillus ochraceoroseus IBT 24754]KKK18776.1 hypothetical protein ARAM_004295 [Aspergillus rambellii]KKK23700.1 hypothetical protein AOCH_006097 [Aspergillus ochraceoroseus]PTU23455.1 hypothetical protein P175DRAFT_0508133 [Aspergillus ochraceoroseus IBT 24754]
MSTLTRAFTKRNKRPEVSAPMPYREGQVKFSAGTIKRGKISAPVELLSTTNMLAYNAPDIHPASSSSSTSSLQSPEDSELSFTQRSFPSPTTTPEVSPIEPNPLSGYFPKRSATVTSHSRSTSTASSTEAPLIPKRALSHTKRTHQELARKRSVSRMSPPPLNSVRSTPPTRLSLDYYNAEPHPFGKELEQVNEVVEEFGGAPLFDEEERVLHSKGLRKFTVDDYLVEIDDLYGSIFNDRLGPLASTSWL